MPKKKPESVVDIPEGRMKTAEWNTWHVLTPGPFKDPKTGEFVENILFPSKPKKKTVISP